MPYGLGLMSEDQGTRERLLDAAIGLIEAEGESAVRVDRVVELAGFTKPVLYHHFADKDAVIVQAQAERYRRSLEWANRSLVETIGHLESKADFDSWLADLIPNFFSEESRHQRRIRNEVLGSAVSRPDLRDAVVLANRVFVSWLANEIERWRANAWIETQYSSHELAEWWAVQIHGRHFVEVDSDNRDDAEWIAITMSTVRHLLGL
jgi:AcrR family transcriptional regulator